MKHTIISVALASIYFLLASCCNTTVKPSIPSDPQMERKIEKTLKNLTLEKGDFILSCGTEAVEVA